MNKKIIIANWKMALTFSQTESLVKDIVDGLRNINFEKIDLVLCPSFPALPLVNKIIENSGLPIFLGSQNVFWEERGSYTGEVSPLVLKELGVSHVIIGHSERRLRLKETDEMIHKKVRVALANKLVPIVCVGETIEERDDKRKDMVIVKQVSYGVEGFNLNADDSFIIAYEPVWAIGSGQAVDPAELIKIIFTIKQRMVDIFGLEAVEKKSQIIYGGSIDSKNINNFVKKEVDGYLIGGASLNPQEFLKILKILSEV